ncbi:MAG: peptidoglycan DD-metalloendopeptidase family protein [Rudaea sp.]|nr:peptidoglycan DD-metalloendopeptidase family protein [Rudaea sp.]
MIRRLRISKQNGLAVLGACALLLAGCSSNPPAPVEDLSLGGNATGPARSPREIPARARTAGGDSYRVMRGDTLYAIAFNHGLDYRDLATWNRIVPPYRIYAGQELRLGAPLPGAAPTAGAAVASAAPDRATVTSVSVLPAPAPNPHVDNALSPPKPPATATGAPAERTPQAADIELAPTPSAPPAVPAKPAPAISDAAVGVAAETTDRPDSTAQLNAGGVTWRWPGNGKVVGTYVSGDQTRQGIDIAGKEGDAVLAAADGEVVYSGNGLLGYGELIIVKHNASFLSAYGHNRKRLVQEGDKVKGGQQIAELGSSASAREELHFEIRKNGKPVNPLDYLPVR